MLVGEKGIPGVIGLVPIHLSKDEEREKTLPFDQLFVDIGAADREDALGHVALGDMVTFCSLFDLSGGMVKSKAIDDRAGCALLIELMKEELPFDLHFAFVVQEEVGCRGAKTALIRWRLRLHRGGIHHAADIAAWKRKSRCAR